MAGEEAVEGEDGFFQKLLIEVEIKQLPYTRAHADYNGGPRPGEDRSKLGGEDCSTFLQS